MNSSNYTWDLATFAANVSAKAIPSSLSSALPILLLDIIAVMLTGIVQPIYPEALQALAIVHGHGGDHPVQAIDGSPSSLYGASYLNGIAAGSFEFEHVVLNAHPSSAVLPTLLAYASTQNTTGEEFLIALSVGYEVCSRIGLASGASVESVRGFHNPSVNGPLGMATAVGNLLGWNTSIIASAMGVAASSSGGLLAFQTTDAMTKQIHPGHAGPLGLEAALLANAGVKGPQNVVENPKGLLHDFSPEPNATAITDQLGQRWDAEGITAKLFPIHSRFQTIAWAIQAQRSQSPWTTEDIANVTINAGPRVLSEDHQIPHPDTLGAAQYSAPFSFAAAVLRDLSNPFIFNETIVQDQDIQNLSGAMNFEQVYDDINTEAGYVLVSFTNSTSLNISAPASSYPGTFGHPEFDQRLEEKYQHVTHYLGVDESAKSLYDTVMDIWNAESVSSVYEQIVAVGSDATL